MKARYKLRFQESQLCLFEETMKKQIPVLISARRQVLLRFNTETLSELNEYKHRLRYSSRQELVTAIIEEWIFNQKRKEKREKNGNNI